MTEQQQSEARRVALASLAVRAMAGDTSWACVALRERAEFGFIPYRTWANLTPMERNFLGVVNQTTASQLMRMRE